MMAAFTWSAPISTQPVRTNLLQPQADVEDFLFFENSLDRQVAVMNDACI